MTNRHSGAASWDNETLPQGAAKQTAVREMFDAIAPRYDMVNRIMTFRLDVRWRKITVRSLGLARGSRVIDLASGTGDFCVELRDSGYLPFSIDISFGMLLRDRSNSPRTQADILRLPMPNAAVDGVTCGFALRNLIGLVTRASSAKKICRSIKLRSAKPQVTRPMGRIAILDVGVPSNRLVRFGNSIYFGKIVPLIGGLLSDRAAYRYLPRSVAYLPDPAKLREMLTRAGFKNVEHRQLSGGLTQLLTATR